MRAAPEVCARAQDVPRGTETLLLVEDGEPVRTVARRILVSFGCTDDAMLRHGAQTGDYALMRKLFTRAKLGHKAGSLLDDSRWEGVVTLGWIAGAARIP